MVANIRIWGNALRLIVYMDNNRINTFMWLKRKEEKDNE